MRHKNALIEHYVQKHIHTCKTKKNFVKFGQIYEISASFSCFTFISQNFAQILKYFVQLCECMIAALRNSAALSHISHTLSFDLV